MTLCKIIHAVLRPPVAAPLTALGGMAIMAAVWIFQYGFGYAPCPLCLTQRLPWLAAIALGLGAWACWRPAPRLTRLLLAAAGLGLLGGAAVGAYHAGVEWRWWPGPSSCSGAAPLPADLEALKQALLAARPVRCDEIPWSLFGLSMAGYNSLLSLCAGLYALAAAWKGKA